jgi:hypothetical protein
VCVENVVRFDLVRESVNDGREGRAERRSLEHVQLEWSWSGNARAPPNADRFLLIWLLSLVPFHSAIAILRPKTIIRWHRPELGHIRGQAIVLAGRESRPNCASSLARCAVQITSRVRPHIHGELLNLIRDPDTAYGPLFVRRLRAMGIRDKPIATRSPWQNPTVAERVESRFASALSRAVSRGR